MYKVFVNNQTIHFVKKIELHLFDIENIDIQQFQSKRFLIENITDFLNQNIITDLYIYCPKDISEIFSFFKSKFIEIKAAGGIVCNKKDEVLMIFRRGKWDLPKGKLNKSETIADCAIREIEEETSVSELEIIRKLPDTYHVYHENEKQILKHCYWFQMRTKSESIPLPQTEEDITEVKWVEKEMMNDILKNTFPSVKFIINKFLRISK